MVREARALVKSGAHRQGAHRAGGIRAGMAEHARSRSSGQKQAAWRTDPAQSGAGGAIGDIGTHAFNLAEFITGETRSARCWPICRASCPGAGSTTMRRSCCGLPQVRVALLWASQVAPGNENALRIRVFGESGRADLGAGRPERVDYRQARRVAAPHDARFGPRDRRCPACDANSWRSSRGLSGSLCDDL